MNKQGVKLYKALPLGTIGRSLADQFSEDQICSSQGFDLIIGALSIVSGGRARSTGRSSLVPNDEGSERDVRGIHVTNQQQTS